MKGQLVYLSGESINLLGVHQARLFFELIDFQFTIPHPSLCLCRFLPSFLTNILPSRLPFLSYILSLALADLLVILTTVPLVSTIYTVEYWPWGSFLCSVSEFMKDVSIGVSVFTLTALSSDRYFAIVDPLRKFHAHGKQQMRSEGNLERSPICFSLSSLGGGRRATRMTLAIAVSIWLLAIICGLPALIGSNLKVRLRWHITCHVARSLLCFVLVFRFSRWASTRRSRLLFAIRIRMPGAITTPS